MAVGILLPVCECVKGYEETIRRSIWCVGRPSLHSWIEGYERTIYAYKIGAWLVGRSRSSLPIAVEVVNTTPYAVWHAIQLQQPLEVHQSCMAREKDAAAG